MCSLEYIVDTTYLSEKNMRNIKKNLRPVSFIKQFTQRKLSGILLAASVALLPACSTADNTLTASEESNVTSEELADATGYYVGETVTIRDVVETKIDESSFLMGDDSYFEGEGVLIVNASSEPFVVPDVGETTVQVTGEVSTFVVETLNGEYGLTLESAMYEEYEDKPVIIAQSIALAPDVGDVAANPERYYNQRIALQGEVEDVLEAGLFTLDEDELFGGEDLLVLPPLDAPAVEDDGAVAVAGVLRPYIEAEFERDYDLTWDASVKESIEAEYTERPILVADGVYPSAIPE